MEPDAVRAAVGQAGWTVYGRAARSTDARSARWLWSVGRAERAGAVLLARFSTGSDAVTAARSIESQGGATYVRGDAVLAVVIKDDTTSAGQLLASILRAVGGGAVDAGSLPGPAVEVRGASGIPAVVFGTTPRPEVIAAVVAQGWELGGPPETVRAEAYHAVAYQLHHPDHGSLGLTLYDCQTAATAVEIGKLDKRKGYSALRRGAVVVVLRGEKGGVAPVAKALGRLP